MIKLICREILNSGYLFTFICLLLSILSYEQNLFDSFIIVIKIIEYETIFY